MAGSGFVYDTTPSQMSTYFRGVIYWDETSQDITANTSNVTVKVLVDTTNASYDWDGTVSGFTLTINGSTYTSGSFNNNSDNGWTYSTTTSPTGRTANLIYSKSVTIAHNSDGTKTFSMSCSFSLPAGGWGPGSISMSGSGTLDTIARASVPTLSDTTPVIGTAITIYTNKAASFTHTISYSFGSLTAQIASGVVDSVAWTPPSTFANQLPNSTTGTGSITCKTYSGSTLIGTKSVNFTVSIPNASPYLPVIGSITHSEGATTTNLSTIGGYVQTISKIKLGFSGVTAAYSSTIKSYSLTFDGSTYGASTATTGAVKGSGVLVATGTVTDSRGRKATKTVNITIVPYSAPKITSFTTIRANSDGTANESGAYVKVTAAGTYSKLTVTTDKNTLAYTVSSREKGIGSYVSKSTGSGATGAFSISTTLGSTTLPYDALKSYDFQLSIADKFNTTYSYLVVSTGGVTMSWGANGIGVGKVWQSGVMDVGMGSGSGSGIQLVGSNVSGIIWNGTGGVVLQSNGTANLHLGQANTTDIVLWPDRIAIGKDVDFANHNLSNVNHITIADSGTEGIEWVDATNNWIIRSSPDDGSNATGPMQFFNNGTRMATVGTTGNFYITGNTVKIQGSGGTFLTEGNAVLQGDTGTYISMSSDTTGNRIFSNSIWGRTYSAGTSIGTMAITDAGTLGRLSSSKRYKELIEDAKPEAIHKILDLHPRTWYDKQSIEQYADWMSASMEDSEVEMPDIGGDIARGIGFIAEEVEEAGLSEFVVYGKNDLGEKVAEGLSYDRMWVYLLPIIKDLKKQNELLTSRVTELESKVNG